MGRNQQKKVKMVELDDKEFMEEEVSRRLDREDRPLGKMVAKGERTGGALQVQEGSIPLIQRETIRHVNTSLGQAVESFESQDQ